MQTALPNANPILSDSDLENYYCTGYRDMGRFLDSQKWADVACFEADPGSVIAGHTLIGPTRQELHRAKTALLESLYAQCRHEPVDYLEFGVMNGRTLSHAKKALSHKESRFFGFDTFEGLPEPWVADWGNHGAGKTARMAGELKARRKPWFLDRRLKLVKGVFQETLPRFARAVLDPAPRDRRMIVNIDCDLYTSTLFVLTYLHRYLKAGDYIYFDEFFDSLNEFAAFNDYVRSYRCRDHFRLTGRAYDGFLFSFDAPASY